MRPLTLLALGDSYTIGEGVALHDSFAYQTIRLLRKAGHHFNAPEIIARTGWTTADLRKSIGKYLFQSSYDFVVLLIGVNDQYKGKNINEYAANFELILSKAISLAADDPSHVFVLSIPDWGQTPFASGRDRQIISKEINQFNKVNCVLTLQYKAHYLSIAEKINDVITLENLAADQLHPLGKVYGTWASRLADAIKKLSV